MSDFLQDVQIKLSKVTDYENKRMFGAYSFVKNAATFGFVMNDRFYFRTDESTETAYIEAGMEKFNPRKTGKGMPYYTVANFVINDDNLLKKWTVQSIAVAKKHKKK